ncbi:MAG TPA: DivIVA domain-containing protein [Acidimicrobiales bacterium]|nr:DivIVA domain-containing protein [Acidimicrobiales bacterium]
MASSPPDHITRPDFGVSVRGYDRTQVDAYFGRVVEWLADAENRATAAERAREALAREVTSLRTSITMLEERSGLPAPQSMSMFSERMGQVMESALQAAQELRSEAEREAHARREAAAEEADRLLGEARDRAAKAVDEARRAGRAMQERIEGLRAVRAETLESLLDLQRRIAAVAGAPDDEPARDGDEPLPVRADDGTTVVPVVGGPTAEGQEDPAPGPEGKADGADEPEPTDPGVLVTATPTAVQAVAGAAGRAGAAARGRRHSA